MLRHDLLFRYCSQPLPLDIRGIVSNHRDFYQLAASYDIAFHHIPVTAATKERAEDRLRDVLAQENVELVVLALHASAVGAAVQRPVGPREFKGAQPYQQAFDRGVKLIGATAHYVTGDLDEGPIIEQDIARADHAMGPTQLTAIGRDTECAVLARAVVWHAERRVLPNGHKTVVFR